MIDRLPDAVDLRDAIAAGEISARGAVETCLAEIEAQEAEVRAFAWLDPDGALAAAEALDRLQASGAPLPPLHGLPVGIKDVIDTAGISTENGTPADRGRVPDTDAWVVQRLRAQGAVILGKTVTTELAYLHPSITRNPSNLAHTPGGSSAGSAAAVAAGMVPLALGTQTGGSVIRPASFCGVTGFKPSYGRIPRTGVLDQSAFLDTLGGFGRTPACTALLVEALFGHDPADPGSAPLPDRASTGRSVEPPRFGVIRPPRWADAAPEMRAAVTTLSKQLGAGATEIALPEAFDAAPTLRETINLAEMAVAFDRYAGPETAHHMSDALLDAIARGARVPATDYIVACRARRRLWAALAPVWAQVDILLSPSALGPAPHGFATTGDAIFNGIWTLTGQPTMTVPAFRAPNGLPMGIQLIGRYGDDAGVAAAGRWLYDHLAL